MPDALFDAELRPLWRKDLPREVFCDIYGHYAAQLAEGEYQIVLADDDYWTVGARDDDSWLRQARSLDEIPGPFNGFSIETLTEEAAAAYAAAIHAASGSAPRVVAHHYTRYLGDLSGGRATY